MAIKEKLAVPLEGSPSIVVLNNGERMTRKAALAAGYKVHGEPNATTPDNANAVLRDQHLAWRTSVLALPEARDREAAATELINNYTQHTMPVANARAFLRGLPAETNESEEPTMSTNDPHPERAARLAEIGGSLKAFNKSRGYGEARTRAVPAAKSLDGVDPLKLKRLAQIRLNALETASAHEASANETKKLRYALQVHEQTGMPLLNVFSQLNVETSKLIA